MSNRLAGIDSETNNKKHELGGVMEIGIVLVTEDIKPGASIRLKCKLSDEAKKNTDPRAIEINGLDNDGYDKDIVIEMLTKWMALHGITKLDPLGCNFDKFDFNFLVKYFGEKKYYELFNKHSEDIINLGKSINRKCIKKGDSPYFHSFSLENMCKFFGIAYNNGHDCITDSTLTILVYNCLLDMLKLA